EETGTYSVTSRGGSEYIWTVTGAELQAIDGRTDKINVYYNQFDELASVSVYEVAANGKQSEVSTINGIKVFGAPCDWRLEMQDSYGDGWNGASLSLEFDGFNGGEYTIAGASLTEIIAVPNGSLIDVSFSSGAWDSEITFQLYDGSGTLILEGGPTPDTGNIYSEINTCP
ncbi:MAG: hypothetical protein KAT78_02200, partial [Flavobacteriaceae bacterium]|nr:hypothetical protein [Flavobacteriaceae bacterium]